MNYSVHKEFLEELRRKNQGNITQTAREFAEKMQIPYSDQMRRSISKVLNRGTKSENIISEFSEQVTKFEEKSDGTAYTEAVTSTQPKTLQDAIRIGQIDLEKWEVDRWVWNSWGVTSWKSGSAEQQTNYQVKVWLKRKEQSFNDILEDILPLVDANPLSELVTVTGGSGVGVVTIADLHTGAKVKDLLRTENYSVEELVKKLTQIAIKVNSLDYAEVHLNMLGDYFESLSGLNHLNTFKSLEEDMWGANPIIFAYKIVGNFISQLHNLKSVNMVSGNHDRMTISRDVDNTGAGGKLLAFMLREAHPNLLIEYHNSVLTREIDGINYLLTHGDKGYSKKADFSKFVLDYGKSGIFNLSLQGHFHSRTTKKVYHEVESVGRDEMDYRMLVCPPVFTGNWYSESLGFSSTAGFLVTENNGNGKPNVFDYSL